MPLDLLEEDVTWVESKLSDADGALGAEESGLGNWLLHFGCASEEFRVVFADMDNWMANSSSLWDAYRALIAYVGSGIRSAVPLPSLL